MAVPERLRLSEEAIANKRKYDQQYIKDNYKYFAVAVPKEEYEDFMKLLKKNNLSKINFFRESIKNLKEKKF